MTSTRTVQVPYDRAKTLFAADKFYASHIDILYQALFSRKDPPAQTPLPCGRTILTVA